MFERNRADSLEYGTVAIQATLADGSEITGKVVVPASRGLLEVLNGASAFIEFEPFEGERSFIAKASLNAVRMIAGPRAPALAQRLRDLDGFDPHSVLGLQRGASWDEVRSAYHRLAKIYHPDRYATAELPEEVVTYLQAMARRVNAAHTALEPVYVQKKHHAANRQQPIYTSPTR
jgi:hypothetical protein